MIRTAMHTDPGLPEVFDPAVYACLLQQYRRLDHTNTAQQWQLLEAAHVSGQTRLLPHLQTHGLMLALAWRTRNGREFAGQLWRLLLVPLGHALGRLPLGNPGSSDVSAFRPMPVRPDLAELIAKARASASGAQAVESA